VVVLQADPGREGPRVDVASGDEKSRTPGLQGDLLLRSPGLGGGQLKWSCYVLPGQAGHLSER